jgi:hypothetical protein
MQANNVYLPQQQERNCHNSVCSWWSDWLNWLSDLLTDLVVEALNNWLTDWLTDLVIEALNDWLTDLVTDALDNSLICDWGTEELTDWLTKSMSLGLHLAVVQETVSNHRPLRTISVVKVQKRHKCLDPILSQLNPIPNLSVQHQLQYNYQFIILHSLPQVYHPHNEFAWLNCWKWWWRHKSCMRLCVSLSPRTGASSGSGWRRQPLDMESSCEYIE